MSTPKVERGRSEERIGGHGEASSLQIRTSRESDLDSRSGQPGLPVGRDLRRASWLYAYRSTRLYLCVSVSQTHDNAHTGSGEGEGGLRREVRSLDSLCLYLSLRHARNHTTIDIKSVVSLSVSAYFTHEVNMIS
ncbi:hypothetical protein Tco_1053542 [Tanacetum coccineum]|uniref:Uncharacterized protein n=1 Tax=Tanacetum coccineum TaxID=301880 RepID=A0ABQ5GVS5_9ASTR